MKVEGNHFYPIQIYQSRVLPKSDGLDIVDIQKKPEAHPKPKNSHKITASTIKKKHLAEFLTPEENTMLQQLFPKTPTSLGIKVYTKRNEQDSELGKYVDLKS